jgi:hypothetical protein
MEGKIMARPINYWTWKDSEVIAELGQYKVEVPEPYDRKAAINLAEGQLKEEGVDHIQDLAKREQVEKLELRKVIFHSIGEQDIPYVPIGHNGRAFYIPKEIEVDIPQFILDSCIKDAVEDRMYPYTEPDGRINWKVRKVQRFPYSFVD